MSALIRNITINIFVLYKVNLPLDDHGNRDAIIKAKEQAILSLGRLFAKNNMAQGTLLRHVPLSDFKPVQLFLLTKSWAL